MSTTHPPGSVFGPAAWNENLLAQFCATLAPIDDEENENYFDGTAEYIDRDDDDEDKDDVDDYLEDDEDFGNEDEDDLG
ncbi:MAG: hypothetical protein QGI75_05150 [Phycisphaerales bacterium]|jgi:hypothetical protein|nr:hypothetical protein [Phycisphaerales bacterium]MDP6890587.1 hypothetical protein [Phycisphaerales bacterium]